MRVFTDPNTPVPEVHLLSNGSYHVMATNAGGGYSRWHDLAVTRWREDATCDGWGTFIYLRDAATGADLVDRLSADTVRTPDHYEAIFVQARASTAGATQAIESAHRDQRFARGRRRDPPRHAHQPVATRPGQSR